MENYFQKCTRYFDLLQGRSQIVNAFDYISNVTSSDREFYFIF